VYLARYLRDLSNAAFDSANHTSGLRTDELKSTQTMFTRQGALKPRAKRGSTNLSLVESIPRIPRSPRLNDFSSLSFRLRCDLPSTSLCLPFGIERNRGGCESGIDQQLHTTNISAHISLRRASRLQEVLIRRVQG